MSLFGSPKAKRMQLFHHDNGDLEFIKRDIIGISATELDETGSSKRSWIDYYKNNYPFDGYKNIAADLVQLAYSRHFHLEIHDVLFEEERPPDDDPINSPFSSAIAESRCIELARSKKPKSIYEKMTLILGIALVIEVLMWGIGYASN